MAIRLFILCLGLMFQTTIFSQTFTWNEKGTRGTVHFDNYDVNLLIVKFERKNGSSTRAVQIYNDNLDRFQNELLELLESSELNYKLISSSEKNDSTYNDLEKYPIIIDHGLHMVRASYNSIPRSYLHLYVIDRKSGGKTRVDPIYQATKYVRAYAKFFKQVKKGKPIKFRVE